MSPEADLTLRLFTIFTRGLRDPNSALTESGITFWRGSDLKFAFQPAAKHVRKRSMLDIIYIAVVLFFFVLAVLGVRACERV